ncbi:hypothetical protein KKF84_04175 [Myxococcota bacterium]|nr:hypothetical protein [Myxococcota bacterium]MBU1534492.1 hypothetical protein [Myxococcota bacterium]
MEKLAEYFLEHLILDLEGGLDVKELQKLIGDTPEGAQLLGVIKDDSDLEEFIVAMTDGLREHITTGITNEILSREFSEYSQQ